MKQDTPAQAEELYAAALQKVSDNNFDAAETLLKQVLALCPIHALARNDLASLLFQRGETEQALLNMSHAYLLTPTDPFIVKNLAEVYLSLEIYNKAEELFQQAKALGMKDDDLELKISELARLRSEGFPSSNEISEPQYSAPSTTQHRALTEAETQRLHRWEMQIFDVTKKVADSVLQYLPENGVFLDVGGNVGLFSALLLSTKPCQGYLFEPVPDYFEYCRARFENAPNVKCVPYALSNQPGKFSLWIDHSNLGWNTMEGTKQTDGMKEIEIEAITFDSWAEANNIQHIDLIKIDVEGAEYRVLKGMRRTLARLPKKPVIICEVGWGPASHPNWQEEVEAFEWLFANGYERVDYNVPGTSDVIFRPTDRTSDRPTGTKMELSTSPAKTEKSASADGPMITLGIPTRNRLDYLLKLIESIRGQTYKNFELLISDDGNRFDLVREISKVFPDLEYRYVKGPGISLPANRQNIMNHARTELVAMCDDDHYLAPDCLEQLVRGITSDKNIGIVSAIWPHPKENAPTVDFEEVKDRHDYKLDLDDIHPGGDFWWMNGCEMFKSFYTSPELIESQFAGGGCLIYRRSAVDIAGGFPQDLTVVSFREDTDMSHRMFLRGYKLLVNPRALAYHLRADTGGCRESNEWATNFATDGLRFLNKLEWWREEKKQLDRVTREHCPIRVLTFYDEEGWAWWNRAHHLKRSIGPEVRIDIRHQHELFDHRDYDFILLFDHTLIGEMRNGNLVPREKIILANSCPRHLDKTVAALTENNFAAGTVNNRAGYLKVKDTGRWFCCQNGVDLELFHPAAAPVEKIVACWTGHSQSIGNKGLELIREACSRTGIDLLTIDAKNKAPGVRANPQEMVRDALYHKSSIYICASEWEGTPNPALEALACGLPVITTAVGNMPELVVDGYNGFIVDRSVEAIVEAIEKIKRSDLKQLSANARKSVEEGWGWKDQSRKYLMMFKELMRERLYGKAPSFEPDAAEVKQVVASRLSGPNLGNLIERREGKSSFFSKDVYAMQDDKLIFDIFVERLNTLPPFFFHFGGAGDALLLLSTFYDARPQQHILSLPNSTKASSAFFSEFPELKEITYLPEVSDSLLKSGIRMIIKLMPNCIGGGATPKLDHCREWVKGMDISAIYGINKYPAFVKNFRASKLYPLQAVLAPQGSCHEMVGGKQNVIHPEMWPAVISTLKSFGIAPIVIGTPDERNAYPAVNGAVDCRSYSFREQMSLIASSDILVGADSWAKTFSAMCGLPTVVFGPLKNGKIERFDDPSSYIFLDPWPNISVIYSLNELKTAISSVVSQESAVHA